MTDYDELIRALRCKVLHYEDCRALGCKYIKNGWCDYDSLNIDAADTIAELSKPRWISVEERLPEKSGHYLAVMNGETGEVYYDHESHTWLDPGEEWENWTRFVAYWMPLPQPPKKETKSCDTCRHAPPSSLDGKPCTMCDPSNPLTSCWDAKEETE